MSVKNLNGYKLKRRLLLLMSEFFIKKLDQQVTRNNDFMIIHDIKYKHELSISYTAFLNQREKAVSFGIRQDF